jgi:hypothetical protein
VTNPVHLGPLPSSWVHAWATDAAESLHVASSGTVPMPFRVGNDFFERNRHLVLEWLAVAAESDVFEWEGDADPDVLLTMMQYWRNLAMVRREMLERGEAPPMHPDAERFMVSMRAALFDVLVRTGRMTEATAARMEAAWPRLSEELRAGDGDVAQHEGDAGRAAR